MIQCVSPKSGPEGGFLDADCDGKRTRNKIGGNLRLGKTFNLHPCIHRNHIGFCYAVLQTPPSRHNCWILLRQVQPVEENCMIVRKEMQIVYKCFQSVEMDFCIG